MHKILYWDEFFAASFGGRNKLSFGFVNSVQWLLTEVDEAEAVEVEVVLVVEAVVEAAAAAVVAAVEQEAAVEALLEEAAVVEAVVDPAAEVVEAQALEAEPAPADRR